MWKKIIIVLIAVIAFLFIFTDLPAKAILSIVETDSRIDLSTMLIDKAKEEEKSEDEDTYLSIDLTADDDYEEGYLIKKNGIYLVYLDKDMQQNNGKIQFEFYMDIYNYSDDPNIYINQQEAERSIEEYDENSNYIDCIFKSSPLYHRSVSLIVDNMKVSYDKTYSFDITAGNDSKEVRMKFKKHEVYDEGDLEYDDWLKTLREENDYLSADEAIKHVGEEVTVCDYMISGKTVETESGSPTFLNLGSDYPSKKRCQGVIWEENLDAINKEFEHITDYTSENIDWALIIKGKVTEYDGVAQIELVNPKQIQIADPAYMEINK